MNLPRVVISDEPEVEVHRLPFADPFRITRSREDDGFATSVVVTLRDAHGRTGLGEAAPEAYLGETPTTVLAAIEAYRPLLADGDATRFSAAAPRLLDRNPAARAALETALLDLQAQAAGVPLHVALDADPSLAPPTDFSVGLDEPGAVAERVARAAARCFTVIKVKLGGEHDVETLHAVRGVFDGTLRVDANAGWPELDHAIEMTKLCADHGVEYVEQPMPRHALRHLAALQTVSPLPIVADESAETVEDIENLAGVVAGINVKLMKCGGPLEALEMITAARGHGMRVMLGCMLETSIAITAMAHLAGLADWVDLDGNLLLQDDPFAGVVVERGGALVLPDRPGLGVMRREPAGDHFPPITA